MEFVGRLARQGGLLATLLVVLTGTSGLAWAADWPAWRKDTRHTGHVTDSAVLPLSRGWSLSSQFHIFPPVVADGVVYVPRSTSPNIPVTGSGLAAYRLSDGILIWERTDLAVWGSSAVSDETIVVGGTSLWALNSADGSTKWTYDMPGSSDIRFENPTIEGGVVYAWKRNLGLVAISLSTGQIIWSLNLSSAIGNPVVVASDIYAVGNLQSTGKAMVWKINKADGTQIWAKSLGYFANGAVLADSALIVAGPVRTFGLDPTDGDILWYYNFDDVGMPTVSGNVVTLLHDQLGTTYQVSFDASRGPGFLDPYRPGEPVNGRSRGSSPVLANDTLVYPTEDGKIFAGEGFVEGLEIWTPELAVADGKLLAWSFLGQRLYTFGTSDWSIEPPGSDPVVFVPGLTTSWNSKVLSSPPDLGFTPQDGWQFLLGVVGLAYKGLFEGLEKAGFEKDEDYFIAHYDWRLPMAKAAQYYLEEWIDRAKGVTGKSKVDIVAHSYGGLIARAYIQSDRYRNDVDQLIMIGTPNQGSAKAYSVWQGGELPKDASSILLKLYIWAQSLKTQLSTFQYIRQHVQSVKDLLPTIEHVFDITNNENVPLSEMIERNDNLFTLNQEVSTLSVHAKSVTGAGKVGGDKTIGFVRVLYHGYGSENGYWPDGKPDSSPFDLSPDGDGTVLIASANFGATEELQLVSGNHAWLVNTLANQILAELGFSVTVDAIPQPKVLYFGFASPVTVKITDPFGRTIDTSTGASTIPDADSVQEDWLKIISISKPEQGEYLIELTGTGDGAYHGLAMLVDDEQQQAVEDEIRPGYITAGQTIPYVANVPEDASQPIDMEIVDTTPPTVDFKPLPSDFYSRGEAFTTDINATDDLSGVASTTLSLDGQVLAHPATIDTFFLALGDHELVATATDFIGNVAETRYKFRVGTTLSSTIGNLGRIYELGWIDRYSTYLKLRYALATLQHIQEVAMPIWKRNILEVIHLNGFIRLLGIEREHLSADGYGILYDDARYLIGY